MDRRPSSKTCGRRPRLGTDPWDLLEPRVHRVPVDDIPPRRDVVGTLVLILQVVGVLPDVETEERLLAFHQRAVLVSGALDHEFAARIDQPRPAAAKASDAGLRELLLEGVEAAEGGLDRVTDRTGRRATLARP